MHEISLVRELLRQVAQAMHEHDARHLSAIRIEIGPLAGVEPQLVELAFARLAPDTEFADAQLMLDTTSLEALCRECQTSFDVQNFCFICPQCKSQCVQVTRGDELRLVSITVECNSPATSHIASAVP